MQKQAKAVRNLIVTLVEFDLKLILFLLKHIELAFKRIDAGRIR